TPGSCDPAPAPRAPGMRKRRAPHRDAALQRRRTTGSAPLREALRPRTGRPVSPDRRALARLGDLRAALELAHAAGEAGAGLRLLTALGHQLGVVRKLEDDRVARGRRAVAADDARVTEDLLQQARGLRLHR